MQVIQPAQIHYNDQGTPVSDLFDDVYFSNESGLEETRYVFLQQNGLPTRWLQHPGEHFHIIETGFGTGLNFLLTWHHFRATRAANPALRCQRLYFSSFEKYPISLADLTRALQSWPALADLAALLLAQYPLALPGCHRLQFDHQAVTLDLWLGDVHDSMPQLSAQNRADAWFLDGFAPSKNPQMWQPQLFAQMARLSQPGTTVATFTSAGLVRRGLKDAGFAVQKIKGYGRKREMSVGQFATPFAAQHNSGDAPVTLTPGPETLPGTNHLPLPGVAPGTEIMLVGGGLAAVCLALALHRRGQRVHLVCKDAEIASGASHNRQGALYPQFQSSFTPVSAFHAHAYGFAIRFYPQMQLQFAFAAQWCGVLTLACNEQLAKRQQKIAQEPQFPAGLFSPLDQAQASAIAGVELPFPGLFYPAGGWIAPQQFCRSAVQYLQQQSGFRLSLNCDIQHIGYDDLQQRWQLSTADEAQATLYATEVVLATGANLDQLPQTRFLPLNKVRGQVSHVQSAGLGALKTVLCHQGYITPAGPAKANDTAEHCVGATFDRSRTAAMELAADDQANLALVNQVLQQPDWFADARVMSAKAGVRATIPDHLPVAGRIAPGLSVLGGLGARGLLFTPLLADYLASLLSAEPIALSPELAKLVQPTRFLAPENDRGESWQ